MQTDETDEEIADWKGAHLAGKLQLSVWYTVMVGLKARVTSPAIRSEPSCSCCASG